MVTRKDDLRHCPGSEQNYSESKWFSFYDASQGFWVSSRIGLEPNRGKANRWLVVAAEGKILYRDLSLDLPLPEQDWDNISVGGLCYRTLEPMAKYRVEAQVGSLALEVVWEAAIPVFDYADCVAPLPVSLATAHYEQSGKVRGALHLPGRFDTIAGTGHRDHSWGVRHWEGFRSWIACMGHFGRDLFFHVEQFDEKTTGVTQHGFISRDGENVPLQEAQINVSVPTGTVPPHRLMMQLRDSQGNDVAIEGEITLHCPLHIGKCVVEECFGSFSWQGAREPGIIEYGYKRD